jgi:adenylate kinase
MQPLIFESIWQDLESECGRANLRFPKELILLGGAPGAGKGTNTAFISRARGLTCPPIVISNLLDSPEARSIKDSGQLVGDREVVSMLLRELLKKEYQHGAIIDGFPRTNVQVECPQAAGRQNARAAARVLRHAAEHSLSPSDGSHHGAVRRRG